MTKLTGEPYSIGYCTNVHAGVDLEAIRNNLVQYAVPARERLEMDGPLGVGLWLPAPAAQQLADADAESMADFLVDHNLRAFTINAFPYDNFHQASVKHRVYLPAWWDQQRLTYTRQLAAVLAKLLPESESVGSISTLPIGWAENPFAAEQTASSTQLDRAGQNLRAMADTLAGLEAATGRRIVLAIEPEPGCILDTTDDVINWFDKHLPEQHHRRYLTVCHDICHSAVMMERQQDVIGRLGDAGIAIGKVQVSNAIVANWQAMAAGRRQEAIQQLAEFAEDRYLHQTGRLTQAGEFVLEEDLPDLLSDAPNRDRTPGDDRRWVVHFHVPIFLEHFGHLTTSSAEIVDCLRTLSDAGTSVEFTGHLEIETYAWSVLPESMRRKGLAEDIAGEFRWLSQRLSDLS